MKPRMLLTALLLIPSILAWGSGASEERVTDAHFALGTVCTISLYGRVDTSVFEGAFSLIDDIEAKMDVGRSKSEVSAINRSAGVEPVEVSLDTFTVIERGMEFWNMSEGKFDLTVQPLVELWSIGTEYARVPEPEEIDAALAYVGSSDLSLNRSESTVYLERSGMAIDLGAIAKGYAADRVREHLVEQGQNRGLLNFGGNVVTFGTKPDGEQWVVGIQDPYEPRGNPIGTVELADGSVVTSGIYERYFERDGIRYHHILDPDTGYPVENELASVSIVADQSMIADAYSTVAFAMGLERGLALLESTPGVEGIFVTKQRSVHRTSGMLEVFSLTDTEYDLAER